MTTLSEMRRGADNRKLVRKPNKAVGFLGGVDTTIPESLYESGSLKDFKADGWRPVGMVSSDGYTFGREVERENITAMGYMSPVLSPVTSVPRTISFTPLQRAMKHLLELELGVDLSGVTMDPETGEVVIDEPETPIDIEVPFLVLGEDGPANEHFVMGKAYESVRLQTTAEEVWGSEGTASKQLTLDVFTGDESGIPVRHFFAGTGMNAHQDVIGFDPGEPAA